MVQNVKPGRRCREREKGSGRHAKTQFVEVIFTARKVSERFNSPSVELIISKNYKPILAL